MSCKDHNGKDAALRETDFENHETNAPACKNAADETDDEDIDTIAVDV